jgi:hypothetical protein
MIKYCKHLKHCLYGGKFLMNGSERNYPCTCGLLKLQEEYHEGSIHNQDPHLETKTHT